MREKGGWSSPHDVDTEVGAELDEELVHLAEVGGVAVGVEEGGGGEGVADVEGDDVVAAAGGEAEHLHEAARVCSARRGAGAAGEAPAGEDETTRGAGATVGGGGGDDEDG